jgi:hypothetical protein
LRELIEPGVSAVRPAQQVGETKSAESVPIAEPSTVAATPTPSDSPQTVAPIPTPECEWQPDWTQEARTDLPMRDPAQIARLLKFETPAQTRARISNDLERNLNSRLRRGVPATNVEAAVINPNFEFPPITTFVRR